MFDKKEKLYEKASKLALTNATMMHEEANLLYDNKHYARCFALGITSLEESAKAFLLRLISLDLVDESLTMDFIRNHKKKLEQSGRILSFMIELLKLIGNLLPLIEVKKSQIENWQNNIKENVKTYTILAQEIAKSHNRKLDAFYIDVRNKKIINPNEMFTEENASALLEIVKMQNSSSKIFVNIGKNDFLRMWNDPSNFASILKIKKLLKE